MEARAQVGSIWSRRYLVAGEELLQRGSGREVRERRDDSENEAFHVQSHERTFVLYRAKPAAKRQRWIKKGNC